MKASLREITRAIAAAEMAATGGFAARAAAAEEMEFIGFELQRLLEEHRDPHGRLRPWLERTVALCGEMESANLRVLARLRGRIRAGRTTPGGLHRALERHSGPAGPAGTYDGMDLLVQGLLRQGEPAEPRRALGEDMVPYQPTPARAILELVRKCGLGPDDLLVDLGSGLGQVTLLAALLSGARALGVEWEPAYVDYARQCALSLALERVEFIQADARQAPLSGGTVYYLYTPFRGSVLREVLARLEAEARGRTFKLCTYGPCTQWVSREAWLETSVAGTDASPMAVFQTL
jgi:hypothetical protein